MNRKTYDRFVLFLFVAFLFSFLLLAVLKPDIDFSQRENRYLQTMPELTMDSLFSGKFMSDFEKYCADQFPFRDDWITLNARYELLIGKSQTNGVYLCGDRLITPFSAPKESELDHRCSAVMELTEGAGVPVKLALIPTAAEIYSEALPAGAPNDSQAAVLATLETKGLSPISLLPALEAHKDEDIFYRTDHHWTTLGAYYAYAALCDSLGLTARSLYSFTPETVSTSFYGTAYSTSGFTWVPADSIQRFVDPGEAVSVVSYRSGQPVEGSLYREESLSQKDQYTYFLGGNTPELVLTGRNGDAPKLVIVRDSFCDSLTPFLLEHYSEIRLLDLRYYLGSVKEYAQTHEADEILVLYSVENFCKESSVNAMGQ